MPQIIVPQAQAETPTGGGDRPFPEGAWTGSIEEVRVRGFPDFVDPVARPKAGYATTDGEITSIQLGQNTPLEGQDDAGNQKFFHDFVTRDGSVTAETVDVTEKDVAHWQLQRSTKMLANLAIALGATETLENEDGEAVTVVSETFLDDLKSGVYNGQRVSFVVYHRDWTSKDGSKSGTEAELRQFMPAV